MNRCENSLSVQKLRLRDSIYSTSLLCLIIVVYVILETEKEHAVIYNDKRRKLQLARSHIYGRIRQQNFQSDNLTSYYLSDVYEVDSNFTE